jgi:hypothetical protein
MRRMKKTPFLEPQNPSAISEVSWLRFKRHEDNMRKDFSVTKEKFEGQAGCFENTKDSERLS